MHGRLAGSNSQLTVQHWRVADGDGGFHYGINTAPQCILRIGMVAGLFLWCTHSRGTWNGDGRGHGVW